MMKAMTRLLVVAGMLLAVDSWATAQRTLTVPDDYPTIQAAIDAAMIGDTVIIRPGRFSENIVIDRPLQLVGSGVVHTRISAANPDGPVISAMLRGGDLSIEGLAVTDGTVGFELESYGRACILIAGVLIHENDIGLVAIGDGAIHVDRSFVVDNGTGVLLIGTQTELSDSEISGGTHGVVLFRHANAVISGCLVGLAEHGIVTFTRECGFPVVGQEVVGTITGVENRVLGRVRDLCPDYLGPPWPTGFLDQGWGAGARESYEAFSRGARAHTSGSYAEALEEYVYALSMISQGGSSFPFLEGQIMQNMGAACHSLGLHEEALSAYEAARATYVRQGLDLHAAKVDENAGLVNVAVGRYLEALAAFRLARSVYIEYGLEVYIARADHGIGVAMMELGSYEEALASLERARGIFREHQMELDAAIVDDSLGKAYLSLGWHMEALSSFQDARSTYAEQQLEVHVAGSDNNLGVVYRQLGRYEEALRAFEAARSVFLRRRMVVDVARVDQNVGILYRHLGRHDEALAMLTSARAIYVAHELEVNAARVDHNIGAVLVSLGEYEEALSVYQLAREVFVRNGLDVYVARVQQNVGTVSVLLGRHEEALEAFKSAYTVFGDRGMLVKTAESKVNIAVVYDLLRQHERSLAAYDAAISTLDDHSPVPGMRYSHPAIRWPVHWNRGLAYEALERWNDAQLDYKTAIDVVESIREHLRAEDLKQAWGEQTRHVYERLIDLLHRMDRGAEAFPYAERSRARTLLDILYGGGVQPEQLISAEAGVSAGVVSPEAIGEAVDEAVAYLEPNEAVLSYFTTERGVYLWVIAWDEEEGVHVVSEPVFQEYPRADLLRDVVETRKLLETLSPTPAQILRLEELLEGFYDALVLPSMKRLPDGVDTLVLVPSGPLWYVPFAGLLMTDIPRVPADGGMTRPPHLVEHYTVAYLPSVASLPSLLLRTEVGEGIYLGLADPELTGDQLQRLGMTEAQYRYTVLQDAARAFAQCQGGEGDRVFVGAEASEGRAHREAPGHRVVVYAAHGQFNPHVPLQSALYLALGSGATTEADRRVVDGAYRAWEILLTDHRGTELVVLAACESLLPALRNLQGQLGVLSGKSPDEIELTPEQLERITTGDEVVGMARAFLSSGAHSVLGTLWQANPGAIALLLASMCRHQQTGLTWAQALRQAQIELVDHPTYEHPWFWAPFQLVGRWR